MNQQRPLIGTPIHDLDTPCLVLDLDALEHNINVIANRYQNSTCKLRPHVKNHKSPRIAHMQIRAGGTVGGVCAAKVAEAEVMVEGGIFDILIANCVVTKDKIERLCELAKQADIKVAVDHPTNVKDLSEAAQRAGATIGVLIEVGTSMHRTGVRTVEEAVELARLTNRCTGLAFRGVMSHQGMPAKLDHETRMLEGRRYIEMCLKAKNAIESAGIPVEIVSSGETWTYDVAPEIPGVTEIQGGTYLIMSNQYAGMHEFRIAGKILGTVISTPRPGVGIGDVGIVTSSWQAGRRHSVEGVPGVVVEAFDYDHVILRCEDGGNFQVGDKFFVHSGNQDIMVNRWDRYIAIRDSAVEAVWDIPARGAHH